MAQPARERAEALYGSVPHDEGIVHVVAVVRAPDGLRVLKIGERSPKSEADAFALSLARVRADAILSTGGILRAEPQMQAEPFGPLADALRELRVTTFRRPEPPALLVLTGGNVDLAHPGLAGWARPYIVTDAQGAARLRPQLSNARVRLVEMDVSSGGSAIAWAREHLAARTITVEAGPSTALPLYEPAGQRVDELMLSVFEGTVPADVIGKPFLSQDELVAHFGPPRSSVTVEQPSGPWRIERYRVAATRID